MSLSLCFTSWQSASPDYLQAKLKKIDAEDYFLGGRRLGWITIAGSLFGTNISSTHFIALASDGYRTGMANAAYEIVGLVGLLALVHVFGPRYLKLRLMTLPELLKNRFGPLTQIYLALYALLLYAFMVIPASLFTGAVALSSLVGGSMWLWVAIIGGICFVYTLFGGLRAVAYADVAQTVLILIGGCLLCWLSLDKVGGLRMLLSRTPSHMWAIARPTHDPVMPWPGLLLGLPTLGLSYWCTDQLIVQRFIAAKSLEEAQKGALAASVLKLLPGFIFVVPGLCAALMYKHIDPNDVFARLVQDLLPSGLRGLVLVAVVAALMSTVDGAINSSVTLIALDLYPYIKRMTSRPAVTVGRWSTFLLIPTSIVGIIWLQKQASLFGYAQLVFATLSPPVLALFILALYWPRAAQRHAKLACICGSLVGIGLLFWGKWHFLMHAFITLCAALAVGILSSWAHAPADNRLHQTADKDWRPAWVISLVVCLSIGWIVLKLSLWM